MPIDLETALEAVSAGPFADGSETPTLDIEQNVHISTRTSCSDPSEDKVASASRLRPSLSLKEKPG